MTNDEFEEVNNLEQEKLIKRIQFLKLKNSKGEFKTIESFIKFVNNDKTSTEDVLLFSTSKEVISEYLKIVEDAVISGEITNIEDLENKIKIISYKLLGLESHLKIIKVVFSLIFLFLCLFHIFNKGMGFANSTMLAFSIFSCITLFPFSKN